MQKSGRLISPKPSIKGANDWYLVQCKPKQDERAENNLVQQGYECARPIFSRDKVVRGKHRLVAESLFPGYLFIHLPGGSDWAPLRSTRGVKRLVAFGGAPLPVTSDLVHHLQERARSRPPAGFNTGDKVIILDGVGAGLESIFMAMEGEQRVVLLINILSTQQRVVVPLSSVISG